MTYNRLSPRQKQLVDFLMASVHKDRGLIAQCAEHLGLAKVTVRQQLQSIYRKYDIDRSKYTPHVRLIYLRALELGLL